MLSTFPLQLLLEVGPADILQGFAKYRKTVHRQWSIYVLAVSSGVLRFLVQDILLLVIFFISCAVFRLWRYQMNLGESTLCSANISFPWAPGTLRKLYVCIYYTHYTFVLAL